MCRGHWLNRTVGMGQGVESSLGVSGAFLGFGFLLKVGEIWWSRPVGNIERLFCSCQGANVTLWGREVRPSAPRNKSVPTRPPCFIDISKMQCIFDMSLPRGREEQREAPGRRRRCFPLVWYWGDVVPIPRLAELSFMGFRDWSASEGESGCSARAGWFGQRESPPAPGKAPTREVTTGEGVPPTPQGNPHPLDPPLP